MKKPKFVLFFILLIFSINTVLAQSIEDIFNAISQENTVKLLSYADQEIEICLFKTQESYKLEDAKSILNDFFESYTVSKIKIKHNSQNNKAINYAIADLITKEGTYRIFVSTKLENDKMILEELRITEKE